MFSAAIKSGAAGSPKDPQFNYVTMLLHGDGSASGNTTVTPFNSDASTNNFNVTINGDARSNNFNPYQEGYYSNYFNGSSAVVNRSNNTGLAMGTGDFTIEFWMNVPSISAQVIYDTRLTTSSSTGGFNIYIDTGVIYAYGGATTNVSLVSGSYTANQWNHIAVVRSGSSTGNVKLYINGTLASTYGSADTANYSLGYLAIGAFYNPSLASFYTGYLSNLRVVKGTAVYTSNFTPSTTPLTPITNTSLLTCQSNQFIDNSTNAFALTTGGSPQVTPAQPFTLPSSVATYGSGYFDGSGDYLKAPNNTAFDLSTVDFTVECWYYFSTTGSTQYICVYSNGTAQNSNYQFVLSISSVGVVEFQNLSGSGQSYVYGSTLVANTWNHIAATRTGTSGVVYVNGVGTSGTLYASANTPSGATLKIGADNDGSLAAKGYITDFRIVKGTRVYTANFTPPTTPLTAISGTSILTTQYNGGGNNNGFKDSSQNNFVITRNGNTTQGTFTPYGSNWSNYFDGASYFTSSTSQIVPTGSFTVECWVYVTSTSNQGFVAQGTSGNSARFSIAIDGGLWWTQIGNTNINVGTPVTNTWNYLAVTFNGTTLTLYVNGTSIGTASTTISAQNTTLAIGTLGASWATTGYYVTGYISNVRVSNVVRTITTPTAPYTSDANTKLLFCQSNRFIDTSSNAYALSISAGSPSVQRFSPFSPTTAYSTSVIGGSGYFDGSGDSLTLANNAAFNLGANNFTIEAWVYVTATPGGSGAVIVGKNSATYPGGYEFNFVVDTGRTIFFGAYTSSLVSLQGTIVTSLNAWNHVAAVRSGSNWALFVNGVRDVTATSSGTVQTTSSSVYVGDYGGGGRNLTGYSSNIRLVNGSAVYDPTVSTLTVPTAPLTAITNTSLLLSYTNAGILDNAMMNDLETVGNAQISTSVKKFGTGSIGFDGTGDWLISNGNSSLYAFGTGNFTIEFWIYISSTQTSVIYDSRPTSTQGAYPELYLASNQINYYQSGAIAISGSTLSNTTWYHIALSRSGTSTKLFVNGTQVGSTYTDTNNYLCGANRPIIGTSGYDTLGPFTGYIDDLRITKGVARYTTNFTAPTAAFPNN